MSDRLEVRLRWISGEVAVDKINRMRKTTVDQTLRVPTLSDYSVTRGCE